MRAGRVASAAIAGAMTLWIVPSGAQSQRVAKHLDVTTTSGEASAPANVPPNASAVDIALQYLREHATDLGLTPGDIADVGVTTSVSSHTGVTHVYLRQRYNGIEVHGAHINLNVTAAGLVLGGGSSFVPELAAAIENQTPSTTALSALTDALAHVGLTPTSQPTITDGAGTYEVTFSEAGVADQPIRAKLIYERINSGKVVLSWLIDVLEADGPHWWNISVDAANGTVLERLDLTVHDAWSGSADGSSTTSPVFGPEPDDDVKSALIPYLGVPGSGAYRVFAWPFFDPNHGPRRWAIDPADPAGSPFGWHDTNGASGPENTETVGNNVDAYLDPANDNVSTSAERVDGGPGLLFDSSLNLAGPHANSTAAAVTNLFYWNNVTHDIAYRYGFDEASGNFQVNHYGKFNPPTNPGNNDPVRAEARDGSGMNNANFSTGTDGQRPRMQMFLWVPPGGYQVQVATGPVGNYNAVRANFGAFLADSFVTQPTATAVLASPANACAPLVGFPAGSIAFVDSGTCNTVVKAQNAQNAGAVGIVVNTNSSAPETLTGTSLTVAIPVLGLSSTNYAVLRPSLPFTARMTFLGTPAPLRDGDFDATVIIHEYGHGISNRLTGGRVATGCLNGNEQMGEGWSDFFALIWTHRQEAAEQRTRGMGPYIRFTGSDGAGIRPTRYSTDMSINPTTYGTLSTGTLVIPHGVGYAWATMLWEVYWNLIDKHGFNDNIYDPWYTGGNNLASQLVMDGLKLQPCGPGFVTGRDAIIQADALLTGGQNACAIWKGFAKRGLGFSASQGSVQSINDGVQAFDLPPICRAGVAFEPSPIDFKTVPKQTTTVGVKIRNTAAADGDVLSWTMHEAAGSCSTPSDVPWMEAPVVAGTTEGGSSSRVPVVFDSTGLAPGVYTANLCVTGAGTTLTVPIAMTVKQR